MRRISGQTLSRLGLAAIVFVLFAVSDPDFATASNLNTVLDGFAFAGLAALGVGVTIIAGEFDLSIGSVAAVAGIIAVLASGLGLVPAVLIAVAVSTVFGLLQGLAIVRFRISSLVLTIGTLIAVRGIAYVLSGETTVIAQDLSVADAIKQRLWIFSPFSLTTIALFVLVGAFLKYHRWGREIFAVGGARNEAQAAGVGLYRPIAVAFALSAATAGLAGSLVSLKSGSATPIAFEGLLLPAVTAALIGGTSLAGGTGSVVGIAIGALTIRFIVSGLSLRGAPFYVESLAMGTLLLLVLIFELVFELPGARSFWARRRARGVVAEA